MENPDHITLLHRRRSFQIGRFTTLSKRLEEFEQSSQRNKGCLMGYMTLLDDTWKQYRSLQEQLEDLSEEEDARVPEITDMYHDLVIRIHSPLDDTPAFSSKLLSRVSPNITGPTSIKLTEIHLPTFDGTIESWHSFHDSFLSTIDRNERLTPIQKFHYLRSSLTGKTARSIQSLDMTELNYSITIDVLKEKFDCHRQICMCR
jgi:Fe-S-cluster formation regulator IscX/YfhJ